MIYFKCEVYFHMFNAKLLYENREGSGAKTGTDGEEGGKGGRERERASRPAIQGGNSIKKKGIFKYSIYSLIFLIYKSTRFIAVFVSVTFSLT